MFPLLDLAFCDAFPLYCAEVVRVTLFLLRSLQSLECMGNLIFFVATMLSYYYEVLLCTVNYCLSDSFLKGTI